MNYLAYGTSMFLIAHCASHAEPPAEREAGIPSQASVQTFAVDSVLLGDIAHHGDERSNDAWKFIGYDLDGRTTDLSSTDVCTLGDGASAIDQLDGRDGRDDAFGASVLSLLATLTSSAEPSNEVTADIANGRWTIQLRITGLDNASTRDLDGLHAEVLTSDAFDNGTPAFDGTTDWPIASDSVDANGVALAPFDDAYVANGTFVAGATGATTMILHFQINGFSLPLLVHAALVTFDVGGGAELTNGVLAGVLDREELVDVIGKAAGRVSHSLCGSAFDGLAAVIRQFADILDDRSNSPNVPCTGISFAMGFHAKSVANPTKIVPVSTTNPCALVSDAGGD